MTSPAAAPPEAGTSPMLEVARLCGPAVSAAVAALALRPGSRGLDAGCGVGLDLPRLGQAVGAAGRVVALDASFLHLSVAQRLAARSGASGPAALVQGDLLQLPLGSGTLDWAWCKDALWGHLADPRQALGELARVVRPGGTVALAFWSSQVLLPGFPVLEARLTEAFVRTAPYTAAVVPERHFLRALGWMRDAGLEQARVRSFPATVQGPLGEDMQLSVERTLDMFFGGLEGQVSPRDWADYRRLADPRSEAFLPRHPDYCGVVTYTIFEGRVPV